MPIESVSSWRRSGVAMFWVFMAALLTGSILSVLVPPLKSPDEGDHARRAYLFSQGYWLLESLPCEAGAGDCKNGKSMSGGKVDNGLTDYLTALYPRDGLERSETEFGRDYARQFRWEGQERFVYAPGTGYYLPFIYAPQAVGLTLGKALDLSIGQSYYLARFLTLLSTLSILLLAFLVHPFPAVVMAMLLVPMSLFQAVSLSIDGFSMAWAVLASVCLLRFSKGREKTSILLFVLMAFSVLMVAGSRAHLASMVLMLFAGACLHRSRMSWLLAVGTTLAVCAWYGIAIPSTVDLRVHRAYTIGDQLKYYLQSPLVLLEVLWRTVTDSGRQTAYVSSFIGEFFNLRLGKREILSVTVLLGLITFVSLASVSEWRRQMVARIALVLTGVSAVVLAFLAMLLTWTPHPATVVEGVQGRYFLIPAMLLLLAVGAWEPVRASRERVLKVMLFILFGLSLMVSMVRMLQGYYIPWQAIDGHHLQQQMSGQLRPSPILSPGQSFPFLLPWGDNVQAGLASRPLKGIGIMLGTYGRPLSGKARLTLNGSAGGHQQELDLSGVRDNRYFYVRFPSAIYSSAELSFLEGGAGFSVWTFVAEDGSTFTARPCVILLFEDGSWLTPGCVAPEYP